MIEQQIEIEKKMTQCSIDHYRNEIEKAKQKETFGVTPVAVKLISRILDDFKTAIFNYLEDYSKGKAIRSTIAAGVISRLDIETVAYITAKTIFNRIYSTAQQQAVFKSIGQALEDEYKMREFKSENSFYYKAIQEDLNKRGAKAGRKKSITSGVFNKRLDFHLDRWTITEKFQAGLVLTNLFITSTGLVEYENGYRHRKHIKYIVPTQELVDWIENMNTKLEVMQPFFLPMVCKPKEWTGVFEGGYVSPYLKRNKLIKNSDRDYLQKLNTAPMTMVYTAINHLQNTEWQINKRVLDVVQALWEEGKAVAELPDREDEPMIPFPYPDKTKDDAYTDEEALTVKKWKRDTYEIHKRNVQKRSIRILVSQILRIANQFKDYDKIWFPYQMDFRGRLYPIPVLLQPQGSDLAKGLLHFAEGKSCDNRAIEWLEIHGANVYGYDKESYERRIEWTKSRADEIQSYAKDPLLNRGWTEADKPFQFLAFCFEYSDYLTNPDNFITHIPIQLDGTCNGLQHYSALLRDEVSGKTVNLINAEKPSDIYAAVADKLFEKLTKIRQSDNKTDSQMAGLWQDLGINRKLTKRPVMVLPYGGTMTSCREYIGEYLSDTYAPNFIWEHFKLGDNPTDCTFKAAVWLSKYLWEAITDTLKSAIVGMDYLKKISRLVTKEGKYLEWLSPVGLLIRQNYQERKSKTIRTELYGSIYKTKINIDTERLDITRQTNGVCPNFIHSLDAACLMLYLNDCKEAGINSFMTVHDCYGTLAPDTDKSAQILRAAFVEVYQLPILDNFVEDVFQVLEKPPDEVPEKPKEGSLDITDVLSSAYFFN